MVRTSFAMIALLCVSASAQTTLPANQPFGGALLEGFGRHHHPVTTSKPEAQKFFDQGLCLLFGFNHDEAMRSFARCAELDPSLAMAHWGIAMTLAPNYNVNIDPPREKAAYEEMQKAISLSAGASQAEKDYINATAKHFSSDPKADLKKLAVDYSLAMAILSAKYPDDLDAATFYAESLMLLHPWQLWTHEGTPGENTLKIVEVLESVLKRNPDHIGANHFYIHAVEASNHPEWALESAAVLPGLAPAAGHLVHMPAHIYSRTGDYSASAGSNVSAVNVDEEYLKSRDDHGIYPMMYFSHNLHFLAYGHTMQGRYTDAIKAADQLAAHVGPHISMMPMLEGFAVVPTLVMSRFGKWEEILKSPEPPESMLASRIIHHFAKGQALAAQHDFDAAEHERKLTADLAKTLPPDAMFGPLNSAKSVTDLADSFLTGWIAAMRGDNQSAIKSFTKAVELEDLLNYEEPPAWWSPAREELGAALLRDNQPAAAEAIFRKQLQLTPRNGRALWGLLQSLKAQNNLAAAQQIEPLFQEAWKNADTPLK
ncbi:MAG TPA: hypothetical protein VHD56_01575 [Tepidisphaeraceae bacterium]|nr:hypothetical protein [Tepidisphaeraceae bacterium]